jgi:hypothetical protein
MSAHCVVSVVADSDAGPFADATSACVVHCHHTPCPDNGKPANPDPIHSDTSFGRVRVVMEWASRTDRQRPLVIHNGSLASMHPEHWTDGRDCWCRPETVPAAT